MPQTSGREWEKSSPFYEDDAWYDVSEWFDGNDYNPTDECAGVWDDETYNYTGSSDQDNDEATSVDSTSRNNPNSSYATDEASGNQYGDSYYQSNNGSSTYDYRAVFYDFDGDNLYDAMASYRDWDNDGTYDDVRFYTFNQAAGSQTSSSDDLQRGQHKGAASRKQKIHGHVVSQNTTNVQGKQHLVVTIKSQDDENETTQADLGPKKSLQDLDLSKGDKLTVQGPVVKVDGRRVLLAQQIDANGQSRKIDRNGQRFSGKIDDLRTVKVQGSKHQLAILASDSDKDTKTIVDLGAKNRGQLDLQRGDRITVKGAPVKIKDKRVVLAFEVRHDGQTTSIDRSSDFGTQQDRQRESQNRLQSGQQSRQQFQSLTGQVSRIKTISVRGKEHQAAILKTNDGESILADLGPKDQSKIELQKGDRLTVRGPMVRANDQRVVLVTSVRQNGEHTTLRRPGTRYSDANQQSVSGTVSEIRTAKVRGEQRQLVMVKTDQGKMVLVDLGPADSLEAELSKGDKITASGAALKAGDQQVLVAFELKTDGGGSVAISRNPSDATRR